MEKRTLHAIGECNKPGQRQWKWFTPAAWPTVCRALQISHSHGKNMGMEDDIRLLANMAARASINSNFRFAVKEIINMNMLMKGRGRGQLQVGVCMYVCMYVHMKWRKVVARLNMHARVAIIYSISTAAAAAAKINKQQQQQRQRHLNCLMMPSFEVDVDVEYNKKKKQNKEKQKTITKTLSRGHRKRREAAGSDTWQLWNMELNKTLPDMNRSVQWHVQQ